MLWLVASHSLSSGKIPGLIPGGDKNLFGVVSQSVKKICCTKHAELLAVETFVWKKGAAESSFGFNVVGYQWLFMFNPLRSESSSVMTLTL